MPVIHHVGYWVDDLGSATARWSQDLGVGPFQVIEHVSFDSFVLTVDGHDCDDLVFDHSAAFAAWGPVVVELDELHAIDDRHAAAYRLAPGAVSHVSWHDGGPLFPHPIEVHQHNDVIATMHDRLAALRPDDSQ